MFDLVVYTSQLIRILKEYSIIVSQKKFVNDVTYRQKTLEEAKTLTHKELPDIIKGIEQRQQKFL